MKYEIFLLGKTKDTFLADGIAEYLKRLKRYTKVDLKFLNTKKIKGLEEKIKNQEAELLLANIPSNSFIVALDAAGCQYNSNEFFQLVSKWENAGTRHVSIVIGGPYGLSSKILANAHHVVSLSKMTFTHDMVRLFFLEQLYRAYTIKAGEKYHK